MKLLAYAIRDKQVDAFMPVFFVRAKGEAMRHFIDACLDKNGRFFAHPADYDLYELSEYDDVTGEFLTNSVTRVMSGLDAAAMVKSG